VFVEDMIGLNIFSTNIVALRRIESCVCLAPASSGEPIVANAPEAVTRTQGTFHRQHALLKAPAAELASRLWDLPQDEADFGLLARLFAG
jgi:hypothetical protein